MQRLALLNNQFAHVPLAPPDPILGLTTDFKNDKDPRKCNLGVGAYRDNDGKPYVFPIVRKVEAQLVADHTLDKEYLPIDGFDAFNKGAKMAIFGWDSPHVSSDRIGTIQTLSGTGALRVIADFLHRYKPAAIYVSNPTWGNHQSVFGAAGIEVRDYRYFDKKTKGLDFTGMIADLEAAAAAAPGAVFDNSGQDCCARSRVLVQREVFDRFVELFAAATAAWKVGDPTDPATAMGPLVTQQHLAKVRSFTEPLTDAEVLFRGEAPTGNGWWHPAMIVRAEAGSPVCTDEIFGPVAAMIPFDDEADAIRICNDSPYGLSGSVWTRDGARSLRVVRAMEAGTISVNSNSSVRYSTPFGGFKQSGLGHEHSMHVLDHYTELKNVFIAT